MSQTCVVDCGFCQVPGVVSRCPVENLTAPVMALTFTDGPMPGVTNRLLDLLSELKVVATFFPTGTRYGDRCVLLCMACVVGRMVVRGGTRSAEGDSHC